MRFVWLLLATAAVLKAAAVREDKAILRRGCYPDSELVATLEKDTPLILRYALSGEAVPCYKVAVQSNGKTIEGYLPANAIDGVDAFDKARRDAAWVEVSQIMSSIQAKATPAASLSVGAHGAVAAQAAALIEASQPGKALGLLETELKKRPDPGLLALAGVAAWRSDDNTRALEYWKASLEMSPNEGLETLYHRVEREKNGDKSGERLMGMRVQLRYEGVALPADTARHMLAVLDEEFARISSELGCNATERIIAIAQSPESYRQSTNAAEWSGGQFDGKIRVPVFGSKGLDPQLRQTLTHEMAHACMALLGRWPEWLQEGVAQKISGETVAPVIRQRLQELAAQSQLPKLNQLGQDWSHLDTEHALLAYGLSLMAVEVFLRDYQALGLRNLFQNPQRLTAITADLDHRLGL